MIVNSLPISSSLFHFSFISLPIFPDVDPLALIEIIFPFPQIDVTVRILENASSRFLLILKLSLINFLRGILDFLNIIHKLAIMCVYIFLEERLDDGCFLGEKLLGMVHDDFYIFLTINNIKINQCSYGSGTSNITIQGRYSD